VDFSSDNAITQKVWKNLKDIALEDGIITVEEELLITNIITDLDVYSDSLDKAMADGIITKNERHELFEGRMRILERAYSTARKDLVISNDEAKLLKEICKIVMDMDKK